MTAQPLFIDVREDYEFAESHVDGALNLPPHVLMESPAELEDVAKDTPIVVYCRTGARSAVSMNILRAKGFTNLTNGINEDHVRSRYHL